MERPNDPKLYYIDPGSGVITANIHRLSYRRGPEMGKYGVSSPSKSATWQSAYGAEPQQDCRPSLYRVCCILYDFANRWQRTNDSEAADVRIETNLNRWSFFPGTNGLHDPMNGVFFTGNWDQLTQRQAFTSHLLPVPPVPGENPTRTVIDICPHTWQADGYVNLWDLDPSLFYNTQPPTTIDQLACPSLTRVLFHEFMHARCYLLNDQIHDPLPFGWGYCMRRKKGEAANCAESLAMLGFMAMMAETKPADQPTGGFTIDRAWDDVPGPLDDLDPFNGGKWDATMETGNDAARGVLKFYADITG